MNKEQFEARIKELLPQTTEQALNAWTEYIQSLEEDEIDPASYLFDCSYVELSLIKQHQGEEVATQLFNLENTLFSTILSFGVQLPN